MELKTFKIHLTLSIAGYSEANTDYVARGLLSPIETAVEAYCRGRTLSFGNLRLRASGDDPIGSYTELTP